MNKVQEALNDLVECARLLGQTQGKKVYGDYTQEDSRFTVAMYQSIEKHSSIIKSALSDIEKCEPVAEIIGASNDGSIHTLDWDYEDIKKLPIGTKLYTSPQPIEKCEPVWYHHKSAVNGEDVFMNFPFGLPDETALYTSPISKEWVGLNKEQIAEVRQSMVTDGCLDTVEFAIAIEAKLKKLNVEKG